MNVGQDLSALDRATLRAWRATNLVGWGAVGAMIATGVLVVANRVVQHVAADVGSRALLAILAASMMSGAAAGAVIGARVYRWPGATAAASLALPYSIAVVLQADGPIGAQELLIQTLFLLPVLLPSVVVARLVWRRRPRALRG
jgi:hypothetical protein